MMRVETPRPRYRWAVGMYDRVFRFWHGLDAPAAEIGPTLRIEIRRSRRELVFADGTRVRRGERVCILHLNNDRISALHDTCPSPIKVALEFRRQFLASLSELGRLTMRRGRLDGVCAFSATTIFYQALRRLGFESASDRLFMPELVAMYQRALLTSLHPAGRLRLKRASYARAQRLWISRAQLVALGRHAGGTPPGGGRTTDL